MTGKAFTWAAVGRKYHGVTTEEINRPRPTTLCGKSTVVNGTIDSAHRTSPEPLTEIPQ